MNEYNYERIDYLMNLLDEHIAIMYGKYDNEDFATLIILFKNLENELEPFF